MGKEKFFIESAPEPVEKKLQKKSLEARSLRVWNWLEKRELIRVKKLSDKVGHDQGNFWRKMNGKKTMSQSLLLKVEKELSFYGL
jgi:hypothetical protein